MPSLFGVTLGRVISHEHRCIFVHIPRCGGTSIEAVIWPGERRVEDLWMGFISEYHNKYQTGGLQHLLASQIREEAGDAVFDAYFKFAFVRNPWEKAVSQYVYMKRRPDLRAFIGMDEDAEFKTYLELIRKRDHVQWKPQWMFVFDEDGTQLVDYVGRFERFASDAAQVFSRLGFPAQLPHENASLRLPLATYYDVESVGMLADIYRRDIDIFGYSESAPALTGMDQNS